MSADVGSIIGSILYCSNINSNTYTLLSFLLLLFIPLEIRNQDKLKNEKQAIESSSDFIIIRQFIQNLNGNNSQY